MKSLHLSERSLFYLLILSVLISFFYNIHSVPLFDVDEGAFSEATREMFAKGDFISTYLNGAPRYDKPILIYWLQVLSITLFGINEFAFRLPSAVASTIWVYVIYLFVKSMRDKKSAFISAIITATSLQVTIIAKAAIADALLNLFVTSSMFSIYFFYRRREKKYIYITFALVGLGFLTKGPVAVLIPLAVSLIFFIIKGNLKTWLKASFNIIGIMIFILFAMPWYVAQYFKEGNAFIEGFFLKHNLDRFSGPFEGHSGSLLYYFPVVILGVLPYTSILIKTFTKIKNIFKDDLELYLFIWFLSVFVFFSFSGTKLPHYVVYGYPAIFMLTSFYFAELKSRFFVFLPQVLLFLTLLLIPEIISIALPHINDLFVKAALENYEDYFSVFYRVFFIVAIIVAIYFIIENRICYSFKILLFGTISVFGISSFIIPVAGSILQEPIKEAALIAKKNNYNVVMWGLNAPSFSVYRESIVERRQPKAGEIVLTKSTYLSKLEGFEILYRKNGIVLLELGK